MRALGRTGLWVTPIGLGGVWLGKTPEGEQDDVAVATVLRALELGINLVDTSAGYGGGRSERSHDLHRRCIGTGRFDVSLTYRDFNLLCRSAAEEVLPLAESRGVGVLNGMVIIMGLLGGREPLEVWQENRAEAASLAGPYRHRPDEVRRARELWE
jgi:aryl-alcohol dehydrogenase-like predicted oxidoreductase